MARRNMPASVVDTTLDAAARSGFRLGAVGMAAALPAVIVASIAAARVALDVLTRIKPCLFPYRCRRAKHDVTDSNTSVQHINRGNITMFHGSIPALVTPFKNGAVDRKAFADLVERQIEAGAGALVPCGTTGESATLSHEEHREVVTLCIEVTAGRIPVIAGAGSNSTREAIGLVEHAKEAGADAVLCVCPYYNRPDQAGLEAHFRTIADTVAMPIILYNVPGRTVSDLLPDTVIRLGKHPNIVGIKDAAGDLARVSLHAAGLEGEQFVQICGDDPLTLGHRAMGGTGCISVTANVAPADMAALHTAVDKGDIAAAQAIEKKFIALHKALFLSPSPGPAKYALSRLGLCEASTRLPIVGPDEAARAKIDAAMEIAGLI
jgi:4-hydroxy-tetrahydrodipicolinate synthase